MSDEPKRDVNQAEYTEEGKYVRKIRSFVRREGRLTKRQSQALELLWQQYGLDYNAGMQDPKALFPTADTYVLEIGFGMGKSLVEMAKNAPNTGYIGIEVHRPGVGACIADANDETISNLKVYEYDAVEVLADCIPDGSLDRVQLFFPDPWHKKKHHKRRIVKPEFIESIRQKLKVGGVFHMATDWENYSEHMLMEMSEAPGFKNQSETGDFVPRPEHRPLTKFEQRGHRLGHGVWDLMFEKSAE
ncbi:tRNA (guanosine(46)-N7)-methyltransferase TrmB [Corallincola holothuriorum]|uniref:tRNA (guanine-N(7)-)-methyltransferase n=1 Tax=Corallincola holothuriorum TaxID=2282215 RepID=A0A368NK59_9GAMM|nr:tRNA (guanosine(46)-N7)-methyltransferase TrmB [Corallincola holothuriorum]RCU50034.1 tRNA (guanosine(46)-N7)-methyltransferase TrmB [Corallincola holothuriorum]